jgi:hypothetical protein
MVRRWAARASPRRRQAWRGPYPGARVASRADDVHQGWLRWSALLSGEQAAALPTTFALEALATACPTWPAQRWTRA